MQFPCLAVVGEKQLKLVPYLVFKRFLTDGKTRFVSAKEVSVHPVGAGTKKFFVSVVVEIEDSRVFEEPAHDRSH